MKPRRMRENSGRNTSKKPRSKAMRRSRRKAKPTKP